MNSQILLLALAPWPTLLSIIRERPAKWVVWGDLPPLVARRFASIGVEIRDDKLPKPFHLSRLPAWTHRNWQGIVVPAMGKPLPSRWPIIRHLSQLSSPLFVASHGRISQAPREIPSVDAFSWAFDRLERPPDLHSGPSQDTFACVRADLLGDVLLSLPTLLSLAEFHRVHLIVRSEWLDWLHLLPLPADVQSTGIVLEPWIPPSFSPVKTAVDLSPPDWPSPLTPAISRSIPAERHHQISRRRPDDGLAAMIGAEFGLQPKWPKISDRCSDIGLIVPGGSSGERSLPISYWKSGTHRIAAALGIKEWVILDGGDGQGAAIAAALPNSRAWSYPQAPSSILSLCRSACFVFGVSTGITHLAALTGTPTIVVEHPTTVPWLYRVPVPFVKYVRPEKSWWCDDPAELDLDRAFSFPQDSYGFFPGEWELLMEEALSKLDSALG